MKKLLLTLIRSYRKWISPLFVPSCRFYPTCSQYSMQAIEKYGSLKGLYLSLIRLIKCNPLHPGGYDPLK
ncbi:MAG: membrane protein insertion efficiency factor YidD [Clostridia bacterium]|nr:membrane protein insertion efficiency factor YidD [Clostridia bacterium]MDD4681444.1 membrane protein insertion efficiency factor YidD [Clostridia bacterium]